MKDWIHLDRLTITGPEAALARFRGAAPAPGRHTGGDPQPAGRKDSGEGCVSEVADAQKPGILGALMTGVSAGASFPVVMSESMGFICCEFHTTWDAMQVYFLGLSRLYPRLTFTLYFHAVAPSPDQTSHVVFRSGRVIQSHSAGAAGAARRKVAS